MYIYIYINMNIQAFVVAVHILFTKQAEKLV